MSNARLHEIALLPLDQRAARIAQMFAEGTDEAPAPRAPEKRRPLLALARQLAFWAHPLRAPRALAALAAFAGRNSFAAAAARRAIAGGDGFCGVAPVPDAGAALDLYAQGLYFDAFPGLASLWSPPRRAVVTPAESLRLPGAAAPGPAEVRLDRDFERLLDICESQRMGTGRRPAFRAPLSQLFALGLAHALELREDGATRAAIVGVVVGGVFTVEGFAAEDRAVFGRAVAALARHLARMNFSAIDFRANSAQLRGLPIELISRERFLALLDAPGGSKAGRWRATADAAEAKAA
jgi:leucyl/phenylalanyl-tRNA--protein transferase